MNQKIDLEPKPEFLAQCPLIWQQDRENQLVKQLDSTWLALSLVQIDQDCQSEIIPV